MYLTQPKYVLDLLHNTSIHDAKPLKSPVLIGSKLSRFDDNILLNDQEYHTVVGALQSVTLTWPDIVIVVSQVCQFLHDPHSTH